jgi:formate dehydrogenase major subunit
MECVIVHDLFLNETANYAHVFLPGSTFLEKDGTFTNAERRIQRVRKMMTPRNGLADWEVTIRLAKAMGYEMHYKHPSEIMDEIAALTPTFAGVSYAKLDELGSVQWPSSSSQNMSPPTSGPDRGSRCCSPPAASSASTMSAPRRAAPIT